MEPPSRRRPRSDSADEEEKRVRENKASVLANSREGRIEPRPRGIRDLVTDHVDRHLGQVAALVDQYRDFVPDSAPYRALVAERPALADRLSQPDDVDTKVMDLVKWYTMPPAAYGSLHFALDRTGQGATFFIRGTHGVDRWHMHVNRISSFRYGKVFYRVKTFDRGEEVLLGRVRITSDWVSIDDIEQKIYLFYESRNPIVSWPRTMDTFSTDMKPFVRGYHDDVDTNEAVRWQHQGPYPGLSHLILKLRRAAVVVTISVKVHAAVSFDVFVENDDGAGVGVVQGRYSRNPRPPNEEEARHIDRDWDLICDSLADNGRFALCFHLEPGKEEVFFLETETGTDLTFDHEPAYGNDLVYFLRQVDVLPEVGELEWST